MILTYDFGPMNSTYDILTYEKKNQDFSEKTICPANKEPGRASAEWERKHPKRKACENISSFGEP